MDLIRKWDYSSSYSLTDYTGYTDIFTF